MPDASKFPLLFPILPKNPGQENNSQNTAIHPEVEQKIICASRPFCSEQAASRRIGDTA